MSYAISFMRRETDNPSKPKIDVFTASLNRIGFRENPYYSYVIDLDEDQEYILGVDQSLSSTGIALTSVDFSYILVFTVINGNRGGSGDAYVEEILEFIGNMIQGLKIRFRVVEDLPPSKYSRVTIRLGPLKGAIESGLNRFPSIQSLSSDYKFKHFPSQWKSTVYDKDRGSHFNDKKEIARDICKIYPALKPYFDELSSVSLSLHDFDGFDAFGLLVHTRIKCFTPDWDLVNVSAKYQLGKFSVLAKYDLAEDFLEVLKGKLGVFIPNMDYRVWNKDESIFNNLIMAANTGKIILLECPDIKMVMSYLIESENMYKEGKTLYLLIGKHNGKVFNDKYVNYLINCGFYLTTYYKGV